MLIERPDITALRLCEESGRWPGKDELVAAGITGDEFRDRIQRLSAIGLIKSFKATLVVPPLLGGDWVWASVLANATRPLGTSNLLLKRLPFVSEILINASLPARIGPNLAMLFYSRDFETEARYIRSVKEMEHSEVYRVAEYSFPVSRSLSSDEKALLRLVVANPTAGITELAASFGKPSDWVHTKLDQLIWKPSNSSGVLRIQPELDWTGTENFGHFHFLLTTGHRPAQIAQLVAERGFELVLDGQLYHDRYCQVEADCWGIADMMERVGFLNQITGVSVQGVLINQSIAINTTWVPGLLQ